MTRTSTAILAEIETGNQDARTARARHLAFNAEIARWETGMTHELTNFPGGNKPENFGTTGFEVNPFITKLVGARECIRLIEASPLWPIITGKLNPLYVELDEALVREQAEAEKIGQARNAVLEAEESAKAKLLAKVDTDPTVKAAKAQLEALQPAPAPVDPAIEKARAIAAATPRLGKPLGELVPDADPEPVDADRELLADFH